MLKKRKSDKPLARYGQFNFWFFLAAFIPILSVGLFNIAIDPYGIFNSPKITGLNYSKPAQWNNTRLFKAIDIIRVKPMAVFLGSSRTDYGLSPNHPALSSYQPAYNLSLTSATPYELLQYFKHLLVNQSDLKLIIIGLDEFMFNSFNKNSADFSEKRLEKRYLTLQDALNTTLSFNALSTSIETIKYSKKFPNYIVYSPKGQFNLRPIDQDKSKTNYRIRRTIGIYFKSFPQGYSLDKKYLENLKEIIHLCKKHSIKIKIFISPFHATRSEAILTAGHWKEYENMKRELVKIIPVWDFSGYNSITTEPINNDMKNYIDASHYRKEVGDLVLNRLLDYQTEKIPKDFGVMITSENIEFHLAKIRAKREVWAKNNPDKVILVEDIKREIKKQEEKKARKLKAIGENDSISMSMIGMKQNLK